MNTKAMLLINNRQAEVMKLHPLLKESVCADNNLCTAISNSRGGAFNRRGLDVDRVRAAVGERTPLGEIAGADAGTNAELLALDVDILIPHQANARILHAVASRLGVPPEKTVVNISEYGNTTAGTIPLATRDALRAGRIKKGDLVLMAAVGAGFTSGAALWRWAY